MSRLIVLALMLLCIFAGQRYQQHQCMTKAAHDALDLPVADAVRYINTVCR